METITWEEVLQDPLLLKCEVECENTEKGILRGPISRITCNPQGFVRFHLRWCAQYDPNTKGWIAKRTYVILRFTKATTTITSGAFILIQTPKPTSAKIFLDNSARLDPSEVVGLDLDKLPGPDEESVTMPFLRE